MNDPLARTTELALVEVTALATVDAVYVPPDIVSVAVLELVTPAEVEAVMLPVIVTDPVLALLTPVAAAARTFPVIVTDPVLKFKIPAAAAAVTLPTITNVPAPLLNAPLFAAAKTFPFTVNVPVRDVDAEDVKNAFEYYLKNENKGRPIIIASHSQGTTHAIRLLKEFFDGKDLSKQLVCAYLVGMGVKKDSYEKLSFIL